VIAAAVRAWDWHRRWPYDFAGGCAGARPA
jgi:hypothetical protein